MIRINTKIKDAAIYKPVHYTDSRGEFFVWGTLDLLNELTAVKYLQFNTSTSKKKVLRGLHYQAGDYAQGKFVWVSSGSVEDVFVDLRRDSPTFGKWDKVVLVPDGNRLWVPPGCAHGFISLAKNTVFNYICTDVYNKESERTLAWDDPYLNIDWKWKKGLIISHKDQIDSKTFKDCEKY